MICGDTKAQTSSNTALPASAGPSRRTISAQSSIIPARIRPDLGLSSGEKPLSMVRERRVAVSIRELLSIVSIEVLQPELSSANRFEGDFSGGINHERTRRIYQSIRERQTGIFSIQLIHSWESSILHDVPVI